MRNMRIIALAALFVASVPQACGAAAVVGQTAPAFSLPDADGNTQSLGNFKGKFVVLEWFNPECPFVRKHYGTGNMQSLQKQAMDYGVIWLSIDSSAKGKQGYLTAEQARAFKQRENNAATAILLDPDGKVGRLYGAKTTPTLFIINPEGVVVYAGAIDSKPSTDPGDIGTTVNYVRQALVEAMTGKPISASETKSYGCSIKYE